MFLIDNKLPHIEICLQDAISIAQGWHPLVVHNNRMISKLCFFTKKLLEKFFSDKKNVFSLNIKQVNSEAQYLLLLKSKWHY